MTLADGQVQVRDLVFGADTMHRMVSHFNPFARTVRADQSGARAWNNGAWSGAEFTEAAVIPMTLVSLGQTAAQFLDLHRQLSEAFAPSHEDLELRFAIAGTEYVMFGRPRLVEPQPRMKANVAYYRAAFVALDPLIYSATEHAASTGLPVSTGGLTIPVTVPFTIGATSATGRLTLANAGTAPAGLRLRINGPVQQPRVALLTAAGTYTVSFFLNLGTGQFLDVDTAARTVYLQGTASRRGFAAASDLGWPVLPRGESELAFFASVFDAAALLDVFWRDSWF